MPNGRRRRFSVKQNVTTPNDLVRSDSQSRSSSNHERKSETGLQPNKPKKLKNNNFAPESTKSSKLDVVIECEGSLDQLPAKTISVDKNVTASSSNIDFYNILNMTNDHQVEKQEHRRLANQMTVVDKKDIKSVPRRDKFPRQHRMKVRSPKRKPLTSEEAKMENGNKLSKSLDTVDWDLEMEEKPMMNGVDKANDEQQLIISVDIKKHVNDTQNNNLVDLNPKNLTVLANPTNQSNPFNQSNPNILDNTITDSSSSSQNAINQDNAVILSNAVNKVNPISQNSPIIQNNPSNHKALANQNNPTNQSNSANQNNTTVQNNFIIESNTINTINPVNQCNPLNQNNQNHPSNNSFDVMCRICHGGDSLSLELGQMISACGCRGTVGRVHVKCLERWLTESGKSRCELCGTRYSTRRVHKYGFPKALAIWVLSQNAKQLMVDSLGIMLMSPLAVVAAWLSGRTLAGLMTPESQQTPWPLASTFVLACMTLVCYYCWIVSAVTRHALGWWIWYRSQYEVRLQLQDDED